MKKILLAILISISINSPAHATDNDPRVYALTGIGAFLACSGVVVMYKAFQLRSVVSIGTAPIKFGAGLLAAASGIGLVFNAHTLVEKYDEAVKEKEKTKMEKFKEKMNETLLAIDDELALSERWSSLKVKVSSWFKSDQGD